MNKSCLLLLVFWYFNFHIVPESQFQASPANQVSGELCWSKKLHITNSQNNSESHWLSQGSASRRASKGRIVLGYLTEPITQTIFNQPDFACRKSKPLTQSRSDWWKESLPPDKHRAPSRWCLRKQTLLAAHVELLWPQPQRGGSRFSLQMASFTSSNYRSVPKHLNTLHKHTEAPLDRLESGSKVYLAI